MKPFEPPKGTPPAAKKKPPEAAKKKRAAAKKQPTAAAKKQPTAAAKKAGRPSGSKTRAKPESVARPSVCKQCGSTERTPYRRKPIRRSISGVFEGRPYNVIVWRVCYCKECGQIRRDRSHGFVGRRQPRKS